MSTGLFRTDVKTLPEVRQSLQRINTLLVTLQSAIEDVQMMTLVIGGEGPGRIQDEESDDVILDEDGYAILQETDTSVRSAIEYLGRSRILAEDASVILDEDGHAFLEEDGVEPVYDAVNIVAEEVAERFEYAGIPSPIGVI